MTINPDPEPVPAPTACPFCRSSNIATPREKAHDPSAYWRCQTCGDMWNAGRLRTRQNRYNDGSRWQRAERV
jgi:transposase-like protein